jgi:hypothetical protein
MKYYIFSYTRRLIGEDLEYTIKRHKESRTRRIVSKKPTLDYVELISHGQLNSNKKYDYGHLNPVDTFTTTSDGTNHSLDAKDYFEQFIKDKFDLESYQEVKQIERECLVDNYELQLKEFISIEKHTMNFSKSGNPNQSHNYIYLLKQHDKVVYVGQSKNIKRPWEHTDKKWDNVDMIEIPSKFNLSLIEKLYIDKYTPIYNKAMPFRSDVINEIYKKIIQE